MTAVQKPSYLNKLQAFSTSEISDALDSLGIEGALLDIRPLSSNKKLIGPAYTLQYAPYEKKPTAFKNAGNYIDEVPAGAVIVIDNQGREDCTVWGEILTQVALKKEIAGTVVHGAIRDLSAINKTQYPLYAKSSYMCSGKNRVYKLEENQPLLINGVSIFPGDFIMGDHDGVIVIPRLSLDEIINRATNIKHTEHLIIRSIMNGTRLDEARKIHHYHQPWLTRKEACNVS